MKCGFAMNSRKAYRTTEHVRRSAIAHASSQFAIDTVNSKGTMRPKAAPTRSEASSTAMLRLPVRSNFMLRGNREATERPKPNRFKVTDVDYSLT
jgi:hypothetical protein